MYTKAELEKVKIIFNRLIKEYPNLKKERINELYRNHNIKCPLDYARFILDEFIYKGQKIINLKV